MMIECRDFFQLNLDSLDFLVAAVANVNVDEDGGPTEPSLTVDSRSQLDHVVRTHRE